MLLIGVKKENGWLNSRWNLTYQIGWNHICKAVYSIYDYYENVEVLVNGNKLNLANKDAVLKLNEYSNFIIRGTSTILKCPIMITFYNQLQVVDVSVPCFVEEFMEADYQKFNMSLCQYMDSIELAMYR